MFSGDSTPDPVRFPARIDSLVDLLHWRAQVHPQRRALSFFERGELTTSLDYAELDLRARTFAVALRNQGAAGQRALLLFPPGNEFVVAFLGCLYAEVVPVPAYPPEPHRLAHGVQRVLAIIRDAQAQRIVTNPEILAFGQQLLAGSGGPQPVWNVLPAASPEEAARWEAPRPASDALAFLQYTSGSTGEPKGVRISHGNLLANLAMLYERAGNHAHRFACWVPLYHDMGLVGQTLACLFMGGEMLGMSPWDFLRKPLRWLELMSRHRATISAAPNFALDLCVAKTTPAERATLDLSCVRRLAVSAEPLSPEGFARFLDAFAPCGLRADALQPSYGLAEAAVIVTATERGEEPRCLSVDRGALERGRLVPADGGSEERQTLLGSGRPILEQELRIVDPETRRELGPGEIGELWIAGPNVTAGYWGRPQLSAERCQARLAEGEGGPFLRTGDLGFLHEGQLFVTGRLKDLIIVRGRNLHPHDLERTVSELRGERPEIRPGCTAAFSVAQEGGEALVLFVEVDEARSPGFDPAHTVGAIRRALGEVWTVTPRGVVLLAKGSLPKTSSGKLMRSACREAFLAGLATTALEVRYRDQRAPVARSTAEDRSTSAQDLAAWLRDWLARELSLPPAEIDPRVSLVELGADSHLAISLMGEAEERYGVLLPESVFWDHDTVEGLAGFLAGEVQRGRRSAGLQTSAPGAR